MQAITVRCSSCGAKNRIPAAKQHLGPRCGRCRQPLDLRDVAIPVPLTDADFAALVNQARLPVLVDFYSPTCGPCQMLAPVLDQLARKYWGRLIIAKLDTSIHHQVAARYQIRGVPTLLFFKNGQLVDQIVGLPPEQQLLSRIEALVA